MYTVYALTDPRTNEVRYIGVTKNIFRRYSQHLRDVVHGKDSKSAWLRELKQANRLPFLVVVEENISEAESLSREAYWIDLHLNAGCILTNTDRIEYAPPKRNVRQEMLQKRAQKMELRKPTNMETYDEHIQKALKELNIQPYGGCVQTKEAARILTWRAKTELGIDRVYSIDVVKRRAWGGEIKPDSEVSDTHINFFRVEDIFSMYLPNNKGRTGIRDEPGTERVKDAPKISPEKEHKKQKRLDLIARREPTPIDVYSEHIQKALRELNITPRGGCVTTNEVVRILSWRAKTELNIECAYTRGTVRKHVYNGNLKTSDISDGNTSYFRIEDIFNMKISPLRGLGQKRNQFTKRAISETS